MKTALPHPCRTTEAAGRQRMRGLSVALCGLARNAAKGLVRNRTSIDRLRNLFKESRVILIENDSTDGTKRLLSDWAAATTGITVISFDTGTPTIPSVVPSGANPNFSFHRIARMAGFRNQYLDEVERGPLPDILIAIDLDVESFSIPGICHTFGLEQPWDAMLAYGLDRDLYYDTYALRERGDNGPITQAKINGNQRRFSGHRPGESLLPLASAFGGLGIYRYPAVAGLRYRAAPNPGQPDRMESLCEHDTFHQEMAMKGHDRLFINPAQRVIYRSVWGRRLARWRGMLAWTSR